MDSSPIAVDGRFYGNFCNVHVPIMATLLIFLSYLLNNNNDIVLVHHLSLA